MRVRRKEGGKNKTTLSIPSLLAPVKTSAGRLSPELQPMWSVHNKHFLSGGVMGVELPAADQSDAG